jgi:hypothetical protein
VTSTADVLYSFLPKDGSVREDLALWKWLGNMQVRGLLFGMDTLIFWPRYFQRAESALVIFAGVFAQAPRAAKSF